MQEIELINVCKSYGKIRVIEDLNLKINGGERVVLLGPSGCGKSTLLRMIAGLEEITSGKLLLDGVDSTNIAPGLRNISMVFQNYALYPNMTVTQNITFALKANRVKEEEITQRLNKVLDILHLNDYRDRLPKDLSGGQRQRVALARAVVKRSKYFLLDEPLSNLDVMLRQEARKQLVDIHNIYKQTFVYVTHDQVEAMTLGERIVLMEKGKIQMVDTPYNVYHYPKNLFTATFIGSPRMNIVEAKIQNKKLFLDHTNIQLNNELNDILAKISEDKVLLGIRPEHIKITEKEDENSLKGEIIFIENLGSTYAITVNSNGIDFIVLDDNKNRRLNEVVNIHLNSSRIHLFNEITKENYSYQHK